MMDECAKKKWSMSQSVIDSIRDVITKHQVSHISSLTPAIYLWAEEEEEMQSYQYLVLLLPNCVEK